MFSLILGFHLCLLAALVPYLHETGPSDWTFQSFYLMVTAIFLARPMTSSMRAQVTLEGW